MMKKNLGFALAAICAILLSSATAFAGAAEDFLKQKQGELSAIVKQPASAAADEKLVKAFDALLDYDGIAKESLGDEWAKRSEAEQKEFQALLRTLVQRAYTKNIRETLDYEIAFQGETDVAHGKLVKTVATHKTDKRKESIKINYFVHSSGGALRVYDIVTEGSSLVSNYKSQFRRVIEKKGFAELLSRMKKKAAEG